MTPTHQISETPVRLLPPVQERAASKMRVAVGVPTGGRRETLTEMLREVAKQKRPADVVVVCASNSGDVDQTVVRALPCPTIVIYASSGLTHKRNAILREVGDMDAIVFFDDDFFPAANYLQNVETLLLEQTSVVAMSGTPIADGINGPGISPNEARKLIAATPGIDRGPIPADYGTYGCNMVFRLQPVREQGLAFDEALPMYGWQEDIDFSRQLAPFGRIVRARSLTGVHLGAKKGRTSGVRFGYSQVANPIYLIRKGTLSLSFGGKTMLKNVTANAIRSWRPETHIDRAGRLKGNMIAIADLIRGQLHPRRIGDIA